MATNAMMNAVDGDADAAAAGEASQLRVIDMTVRSDRRFPVPSSDGYPLYSALLAAIRDADAAVSEQVHDSPIGSLHTSGLLGNFAPSDREKHKTVRATEPYQIRIGITDPADGEIFDALVKTLVLSDQDISLTNGSLRVESFESSKATHYNLLQRAAAADAPLIDMDFRSPTCIFAVDTDGTDAGHGGITTMYPHRGAVFCSLREKWNATAPDALRLDLSRGDIERNVYAKPGVYGSDSVVVNRGENGDLIHREGFHGSCSYAFKNASESIENAVTALALFAEYSGVGSAVGQGCGTTDVTISD